VRHRFEGPQEPKPYTFVEISPLEQADRKSPAGHDRYLPDRVSGHLDATLIVVTPLHVSSGTVRMTNSHTYPLVRSVTRRGGRPIVPASTLKGMTRSVVEAITHSCVRVTRARPDNLPEGAAACRNKKQLCLACRMFGAMGYEGQIRFTDAVLGDEYQLAVARMPSLFAPRSRTRAYFDGDQVRGRKFYRHGQTVTDANTPVENFRPESMFEFSVHFDNLSPGEVGVLLTALGLGSEKWLLKVGGGKPPCYGSVVVQKRALQVWREPGELYASYQTSPTPAVMPEYLNAAKSLLEPAAVKEFARAMEIRPERNCPRDNY